MPQQLFAEVNLLVRGIFSETISFAKGLVKYHGRLILQRMRFSGPGLRL